MKKLIAITIAIILSGSYVFRLPCTVTRVPCYGSRLPADQVGITTYGSRTNGLRPMASIFMETVSRPFSETNKIKLTVGQDKTAISWMAAYMVLSDYNKAISEKGYYVLGTATGSTPIELYAILVNFAEMGLIDFSKVITFQMDEYEGLPPRYTGDMTPENPGNPNISYKAFMYRHLYKPLFDKRLISQEDINNNMKFFESNPENAAEMLAEYELRINSCGGVDTWIGGLGCEGHLALNLPKGFVVTDGKRAEVDSQTTPQSVSRRIFLTQEIINVNCSFFEFIDRDDPSKGRAWVIGKNGELVYTDPGAEGAREIMHEEALAMVPRTAFSIGIATYKNAKHQIILANGEAKADAVAKGMEGRQNNNIALSLLQDCPNCDLIIDTEAAVKLHVDRDVSGVVRKPAPKPFGGLSPETTRALEEAA